MPSPRTVFALLLPMVAVAAAASQIPLCQGLTIVTAVNSAAGDYESIKTVESISDDRVRIKYSAEGPNNDIFSDDPSPIVKTHVYRSILKKDLQSATLYEQVFAAKSDEIIPDTTSIGVSTAVLDALKTKGEIEIGLSNAYSVVVLSGDREVRPNAYDYMLAMPLKLVGTVRIPVLVNDTKVELSAIQASGEAFEEKYEFFFLDDRDNPLTLKFRLGVDTVPAMRPEMAELCKEYKKQGVDPKDQCRPKPGDRDVLRVVKINHHCGGSSALEEALAETRRADVYSIYFTFNSDEIRDESQPALKEIAGILQKHPDWKLRVNGHTDNIAGDAYNLALSQRRAAAVKNALVKQSGVDPKRLTTAGLGKSQPKDTNETIEGRSRNRRVELIRM